MHRANLKPLSFLFLAASIGLLAPAAPVAADTPVGHSGTVGRHYLADSEEYPGARCHYDSDQDLDRIRVVNPFVFSVSNDEDSRSVSWRVLVQKRVGSGAWTAVKWSPVQFGEATTTVPAALSPISVDVNGDSAARYRVLVRMAWYVGGKSINKVGTATHRVDWYRYPLADANHGFCPGGIL